MIHRSRDDATNGESAYIVHPNTSLWQLHNFNGCFNFHVQFTMPYIWRSVRCQFQVQYKSKTAIGMNLLPDNESAAGDSQLETKLPVKRQLEIHEDSSDPGDKENVFAKLKKRLLQESTPSASVSHSQQSSSATDCLLSHENDMNEYEIPLLDDLLPYPDQYAEISTVSSAQEPGVSAETFLLSQPAQTQKSSKFFACPDVGSYKLAVSNSGKRLYFPYSRAKLFSLESGSSAAEKLLMDSDEGSKKLEFLSKSIYKLMDEIEAERTVAAIEKSRLEAEYA